MVEEPKQIIAHWSNNLTLTIVSDASTVNIGQLTPLLKPHYTLAPTAEGVPHAYYPPLFPNDFWLLRENMLPINSSDATLPLHVTYAPISHMKFQLFATMTQSMDQAAAQQGSQGEMDEIKRMLTETSPWLLVTTAIVTVLHMLFESSRSRATSATGARRTRTLLAFRSTPSSPTVSSSLSSCCTPRQLRGNQLYDSIHPGHVSRLKLHSPCKYGQC